MVDCLSVDGVDCGLIDVVLWFVNLTVVFVGWLVVACDCSVLFDDVGVGFVAVGFVVADLVTVGFTVDVGFVGFSVMTVRCVVVTLLISVVVRGFTWMVVLVTLGTVETTPNDCAVVFEVIGSETVVVFLDGLAVDTVNVAGVVNVVSGIQYENLIFFLNIDDRFVIYMFKMKWANFNWSKISRKSNTYLGPIGMFAIWYFPLSWLVILMR